MTTAKKNRSSSSTAHAKIAPRSWVISVIVAAVILAITITLSATINPLFGRAVHWNWVAGIAPVAFLAVLLSTRNRWL